MGNTIKPLSHIFQKSNQLTTLISQADKLTAMDAVFKSLLPNEYRPYCNVANFSEGLLVISITHQSAVMRLRFLTPELLSLLQNNSLFQGLQKIKLKIMLPQTKPILQQHKTKPLSAENRKILDRVKTLLQTYSSKS